MLEVFFFTLNSVCSLRSLQPCFKIMSHVQEKEACYGCDIIYNSIALTTSVGVLYLIMIIVHYSSLHMLCGHFK